MNIGPEFPRFALPIIQAPLAGGPSTPQLTAAVTRAGGYGFLAAGYKAPEAVRSDIDQLRALGVDSFGLNLFLTSAHGCDPQVLQRYIDSLRADAARYGVQLGKPVHDDDALEAKLELAIDARVPVISFTFGCPSHALIERLRKNARFDGAREIIGIDGLRVEYPDGFGLARASNTTPVVVLRFEADNAQALERIQNDFRRVLQDARPGAQLPF